MASTRRSRPADGDAVAAAAASALAALAGRRAAVALSGGRDSAALLVACAQAAQRHAVTLVAIHVHHGLSPHADAWTATCEQLARRCAVPLHVERVRVEDARALGTEAAARAARYAALRRVAREQAIGAVLLAHHQDDQAETLLLQALRGAGPHGLAAMPPAHADAVGIAWLRPLLGVPRAAIDRYVGEHAIAYVDDDSNASTRHARNALRHDVLPALMQAFPEAARTLARVAAHQAEAAQMLDELAALDAAGRMHKGALDAAALATLGPARARNLLRWFLRQHDVPAPSTARLHAMLVQLATPRRDAAIDIAHAGIALGVYRGRIVVHAAVPAPYSLRWHGEGDLRLPHGRLTFVSVLGSGIAAARLAGRHVTIASRQGGERLAPHPRRPRRALAAWLYDAALPRWERAAQPLVFCDGDLVAAPAVGVDVAYQAGTHEPGWRVDWHPDPPLPRVAG